MVLTGKVAETTKEEKVSSKRKYFEKRKVNIHPEERGGTKWSVVAWLLTLRGISGRWGGGGVCCRVGSYGEQSALMGTAPFPLFYCPTNSKARNTFFQSCVPP